MKLYGGIDLHSNNSIAAVVNEEDRVVFQRRLANDLERILLVLAQFQQWLIGVVVESTYNWYWLVDGLMQAGYTCTWRIRRRWRNIHGPMISIRTIGSGSTEGRLVWL